MLLLDVDASAIRLGWREPPVEAGSGSLGCLGDCPV
jgi:hypothetical protein